MQSAFDARWNNIGSVVKLHETVFMKKKKKQLGKLLLNLKQETESQRESQDRLRGSAFSGKGRERSWLPKVFREWSSGKTSH